MLIVPPAVAAARLLRCNVIGLDGERLQPIERVVPEHWHEVLPHDFIVTLEGFGRHLRLRVREPTVQILGDCQLARLDVSTSGEPVQDGD